MNFGTVCSGILGAELAWEPLGWKPLWCSEIDRFPSSVIAHHRKDLKNLGDFTRINPIPDTVDLLAGGTPCQSFSQRGDRGGVKDRRGDLALQFADLATKVGARWVVWENVRGVLSSNKGRDFGLFLGALASRGYHCAYRVLDARFWNLPQSRQRVFVVGYTGDWRPPAAVLFEPNCLSWNAKEVKATEGQSAGSIRDGIAKCCTARGSGSLDPTIATYLPEDDGQNVRKLTPLEYERLQGFPDNWTLIPGASNTARYKAVGNAWPVPVARWIGERIQRVELSITPIGET